MKRFKSKHYIECAHVRGICTECKKEDVCSVSDKNLLQQWVEDQVALCMTHSACDGCEQCLYTS